MVDCNVESVRSKNKTSVWLCFSFLRRIYYINDKNQCVCYCWSKMIFCFLYLQSKWHQLIHQYNSSKDIDITYSNAKVEYRSHDNPDRDPDEVVRSDIHISHRCLPPCAHSDTCRPYPTGSEMTCSFLTAGAHDPSRFIAGRAVVTRKDRLDAVE